MATATREIENDDEAFRPSPSLQHFLRLAKAGRHRGSSGGEKTARKLAEVFLEGSAIDSSAMLGFFEFMELAKGIGYWEAEQLIK